MTALTIVQARMGSSRFPGKSLAEINGQPILWYLFRQLSYCRNEATPILATTDQPQDDPLAAWAEGEGIAVFRGSENDVLARYHGAAAAGGAGPETPIVRVTGDDILPDPHLIDAALDLLAAFRGRIDCVFTADDGRFPYGVYVECYTFRALAAANVEASAPEDREHVTPYIRRNADKFPRVLISSGERMDCPPLSIDTPEDLERIGRIVGILEAEASLPYTVSDILNAAGKMKETAR